MNKQADSFEQAVNILKSFTAKNIHTAHVVFFSTLLFLWFSLILNHYFFAHFRWGLLLSIPLSTIFMCRSYVVEHDCGHGSFYRKESSNFIAGSLIGFGILIPYSLWKFIHHSHHLHVGNLDQRGLNPEIWTMTVAEYQRAPRLKKWAYRFMRSKFTRFTIVPTINLGLVFRFVHPKFNWKANIAVIVHDILYVFIFWKLSSLLSWTEILVIFYLPLVLFYFVASFTFYAQHQFEDTYWEEQEHWNYEEASFRGSTYIDAPRWYCWLTGNVVYHNIHHLMSGIPFYQLPAASKALGQTIPYRMIPLSEVWKMLSCKVWDEDQKKLIPFPADQRWKNPK